MQYLEQLLGTELGLPARFLIAFVAVMVLIAISAAIIRAIASARAPQRRGRGSRRNRLAIGEWIFVDDKRKLVLVRRDDVEHLLLIGGSSDIVVESDTGNAKEPATAAVQMPPPPPDVLTPPEETRAPAIDVTYRSPLRPDAASDGTARRVEPKIANASPVAVGPRQPLRTAPAAAPARAAPASAAKPAPVPQAAEVGDDLEAALIRELESGDQ